MKDLVFFRKSYDIFINFYIIFVQGVRLGSKLKNEELRIFDEGYKFSETYTEEKKVNVKVRCNQAEK